MPRRVIFVCILLAAGPFTDLQAEGLLRIGLQLHNEPQTNRPCSGPNAQQDYLSTCLVMDSLMSLFARHGARITFEMGLGNALNTPLFCGDAFSFAAGS